MAFKTLFLILVFILSSCSSYNPNEIYQKDEPKVPFEVPLFDISPSIEKKSEALEVEPNPVDDSVLDATDETIKIRGCEEWKKKNPKADC